MARSSPWTLRLIDGLNLVDRQSSIDMLGAMGKRSLRSLPVRYANGTGKLPLAHGTRQFSVDEPLDDDNQPSPAHEA